MPDSFHTLAYPASPAVSRALFLPVKAPAARRTYRLSLANWLGVGGTTIQDVQHQADPSLQMSAVTHDATGIGFVVAGGSAGFGRPVIAFTVTLANGDVEPISLTQPVVALPAPRPPLNAALFNGAPLLFASQPLTFGALHG